MALDQLLDDIPRGVTSRKLSDHQTPLAAFACPKRAVLSPNLAYDMDAGDKILLGALGDQFIGTGSDHQICTFAGARSGKSTGIINNLLAYRGSTFIIDLRGELANRTAKYRAEVLGQTVLVADPFEITEPWVAPYRASFDPIPILHPDSKTLIEDAGLITDALVITTTSEKDPHWNESAKNILEGLCLLVATCPLFEGHRNLVTVRQLLMEGIDLTLEGERFEGMNGLEALMLCNQGPAGQVISFAARDFFDKPDNERGGVLSTARRHTKFLDFPALQNVLMNNDFDLAELKTDPNGMSVYLCLPATRLETCNRWFRLFINLALSAMEHEKTKTDLPVVMICDEFASLGHVSLIETFGIPQGAGHGVKLWPILQDMSQLKSIYKAQQARRRHYGEIWFQVSAKSVLSAHWL